MDRDVELIVNGKDIFLNRFVADYFYNVANSMFLTLKEETEPNIIKFDIDNKGVKLFADEKEVKINKFIENIIKNTVYGMTASLNDVGEIESIQLTYKR